MLQPKAISHDRARSSATRSCKCYYAGAVIVALLAFCVGMYFLVGHSNIDSSCVVTASPTVPGKTMSKTPVSILLEYCQHNKLKDPEYTEVPAQNANGFSYVVTVKGNAYNGIVKTNKREAKQSAAIVAVQQLGLSKNIV